MVREFVPQVTALRATVSSSASRPASESAGSPTPSTTSTSPSPSPCPSLSSFSAFSPQGSRPQASAGIGAGGVGASAVGASGRVGVHGVKGKKSSAGGTSTLEKPPPKIPVLPAGKTRAAEDSSQEPPRKKPRQGFTIPKKPEFLARLKAQEERAEKAPKEKVDEADRKAAEEEARKAREEALQKAKKKAAREAKEEAAQKAKGEASLRAARKAEEKAARKAREDAARKVKGEKAATREAEVRWKTVAARAARKAEETARKTEARKRRQAEARATTRAAAAKARTVMRLPTDIPAVTSAALESPGAQGLLDIFNGLTPLDDVDWTCIAPSLAAAPKARTVMRLPTDIPAVTSAALESPGAQGLLDIFNGLTPLDDVNWTCIAPSLSVACPKKKGAPPNKRKRASGELDGLADSTDATTSATNNPAPSKSKAQLVTPSGSTAEDRTTGVPSSKKRKTSGKAGKGSNAGGGDGGGGSDAVIWSAASKSRSVSQFRSSTGAAATGASGAKKASSVPTKRPAITLPEPGAVELPEVESPEAGEVVLSKMAGGKVNKGKKKAAGVPPGEKPPLAPDGWGPETTQKQDSPWQEAAAKVLYQLKRRETFLNDEFLSKNPKLDVNLKKKFVLPPAEMAKYRALVGEPMVLSTVEDNVKSHRFFKCPQHFVNEVRREV